MRTCRNFNYIDLPVRDWVEVVAEFNRRNPDKPLPNAHTAKAYHTTAMKKLCELLKNEREELFS